MIRDNLIIDKSSVDLNYLFKSLKIVEANNGIERISFIQKMELYMAGEIITRDNENERSRTQFNKTKLARYYGLLRTSKINKKQFIYITKRGKEVCDIIEEGDDGTFKIVDEEKFRKIILSSIVYDTFGKNNDGVERSKSDIEPPKILLKAILDLEHITSEEFIYLIYSLNNGDYESYEHAISDINSKRKLSNDFMKNKIAKFGRTNFVNDNKLISFFKKIGLIEEYENKYYLSANSSSKYENIIKNLNPFSKNLQLIVVGPTGSGKSHYVNNIILGHIVESKQIVRTIIHPNYNYLDFIGYIKPSTHNKKINYQFEPGPFTIALEKCLKNPKSNIFLVIEEINRGNIAAILGDTIQLLDRIDNFKLDDHGKSDYTIKNFEIYNYLNDKLNRNQMGVLKEGNICLPQNFNIIMTLNLSEQNNYYLDTAFKRRFNYIYLNKNNPLIDNHYLKEIDAISKENIFNNHYTWSEFILRINKTIDKLNKDFYTIPESKKLSPYFVNIEDVKYKEQFCDKVIYYLKTDVFRYNETILNENYDYLKHLFVSGVDFFKILEGNYEKN